ncbi:hypothetical protein [Nucisporomicrobium flavum]|uniref:hypothetical protein n=1 Tax=Nucisporomicrobium flavum TaxID=2785915 RepID=UPI0018F2F297|nr:hypothetical protein [Nucisporomicrobium flavum]
MGDGQADQAVQLLDGVSVSASALPSQLKASKANAQPGIAYTKELSDTFDLAPSGALPATAKISLPLREVVSAGTGVAVATSESPDQFRKQFIDPFSDGAFAEAAKPACSDESSARTDGYAIGSDSGSTVYWCLGKSDSGRMVKVVNNRRYPLLLSRGGLSVTGLTGGSFWRSLSSHSSGQPVVIGPRETATLAVTMPPGDRAQLVTAYDGFGQSLVALYTGLKALSDILTRFGKGGPQAAEILGDVLQLNDCLEALGKGPADLLAKCFSPESLYRALGGWAFLVIPLMVFAPVLDFFRTQFNVMGDQLNHRDRYAITISHAAAVSVPEPAHNTGGDHDGKSTDGPGVDGKGTSTMPPQPENPGPVRPEPAAAAPAIFTVMNTSEAPPDGVWFRNSPQTSDTDRITGLGVYVNEQVRLDCYAWGESVGAYENRLWCKVTNQSRTSVGGRTNAGYLNAHYVNDGNRADIVADGVPAC